MADVIHATERAVEAVRVRAADYGVLALPSQRFACGTQAPSDALGPDFRGHFMDKHGIQFVVGTPELLPTCPECRRLLDEALDPTFERDRAVAAAWSKVADAVRES
jgi:hypothetical protein